MKFIVLAVLIISISCFDVDRLVNDENFIEEINQKATTWTAGSNENFSGKKLSDAKKLLGVKRDENIHETNFVGHEFHHDIHLEHFDLRERYPFCHSLHLIRDQSICGSCWAVAAGEITSDRICIASHGKQQPLISADHLMSCCSNCGDGCEGGYPLKAMLYWMENGIPTGGNYHDYNTCQPYPFPPCSLNKQLDKNTTLCPNNPDFMFPTPACSESCNKKYGKNLNEDRWFAQKAYKLANNEDVIKADILKHGSVEAAFDVYADFMNYKSGVYQHVTGDLEGGHAIRIVGWGVENGVKYWQAINSWNIWWGVHGTFRILRGVNECGIESGVVGGIPFLKEKHNKHHKHNHHEEESN